MLRALLLANMVGLNLFRRDNFEHPTAAVVVVGVLVAWTVFALWAYAEPARPFLASQAEPALTAQQALDDVLDLADELALSTEQRARSQRLFASMQADARRIGRELVDAETRLDRSFASRSIDAGSLAAALDRIGSLQASLRGVHLRAHLLQVEILTPEQIAAYDRLRGYAAGNHSEHQQGH